MEEVWKVFPEDSRYSVSDAGMVKNNQTGKVTCGFPLKSKAVTYYRFRLGKKGKTLGVHYMVLSTFVPKPGEDYIPDHIDRNPLNNKLSNLRWITVTANTLNSTYRTFYRFNDKGEYVDKFNGWSEAAKSVNVNGDYLRNRTHMRGYDNPLVNGFYFVSQKDFHKQFKYIW